MSDSTNQPWLPPPAFPPGQRRHAHRQAGPRQEPDPGDASAMIAPEDPIPLRRDPIEQAFILPDEPIPERKIDLPPDFADHASAPTDPWEGEVVGMDLDADTEPVEVVTTHDPRVEEIAVAVAKLSQALHRKGEAGLKTSPEMSRLEATLRAYCLGYLAGRRVEDAGPEVGGSES